MSYPYIGYPWLLTHLINDGGCPDFYISSLAIPQRSPPKPVALTFPIKPTMDLSAEDLEAFQTVAGLLGRTVDQLIQLRQPSPGTRAPQDIRNSEGGETARTNALDTLQREVSRPDSGFRLLDENDFPSVAHARYDCNNWLLNAETSIDFSDLDTEFLDQESHVLVHTETSSWCEVPSQGSAPLGASMDTFQTKPSSSDVALESASSSPSRPYDLATVSSSGSSNKRRYVEIMPMPGPNCVPQTGNISPSTVVNRPKRAKYTPWKREQVAITRSITACIRCRMQRNECIPDSRYPTGPCLPCQKKASRIVKFDCLRFKIVDCTLFRTGLEFVKFYKEHPLVGRLYGDFHLNKTWRSPTRKYLRIGQDRGRKDDDVSIEVELREFVPPENDTAVDVKGRPMYCVPWAMTEQESVIRVINTYIEESLGLYISSKLDASDPLVFDVICMAHRTSILPVKHVLLHNAIRLWVGCRMIEGKWQCSGDDEIRELNPMSPYTPGRHSLPPYLDYQIASVIIQKVLMPLRQGVLHNFQAMVLERKREDWFVTFLVSFILLHNYELQMQFQQSFSAKRRMKFLYADVPLMAAINCGAKIILAHFHYCCRAQQPFRPDFDWSSAGVRKMAHLTEEQVEFMKSYHQLVLENASMLECASRCDNSTNYHAKYWYTSQLFDPDWVPRDTPEHSPLRISAETSNEKSPTTFASMC